MTARFLPEAVSSLGRKPGQLWCCRRSWLMSPPRLALVLGTMARPQQMCPQAPHAHHVPPPEQGHSLWQDLSLHPLIARTVAGLGPFVMCSKTWGQEHPRVWIRVMLCTWAVLAPWRNWWALITLSSVTWTPTHPSVCPLAKSCCCYQPQSLAGLPPAQDNSQGCKGRAGRCICAKRTGCWQHRAPQPPIG